MRRPWRSTWYRDTCATCGAPKDTPAPRCGPWTIIYAPACGTRGIVTEEHLGWRRPKGQGWTQT